MELKKNLKVGVLKIKFKKIGILKKIENESFEN